VRILLYSHAFLPSLGGIERSSQLLAEALAHLGHRVDVVTATPTGDPRCDQQQPYRIWRLPPWWRLLQLIAKADVVHGNGASLVAVLPALLLRRPSVWTHQAWQLLSVDGLGWAVGGPTPLDPAASLRFYRHRLALLPWLRQWLLLHLRCWVAHRLSANVAISHWMAWRQPLPRLQVIPNPVALPSFSWSDRVERSIPLLFLGRLVSEKGLDVLLDALHGLAHAPQPLRPALLVVGDGPMRQTWQQQCERLGLAEQVRFLGSRQPEQLPVLLNQARIGVVPSAWEEPMGLVAVELIAAGLIPVVAERGGLAENIGNLGRSFANRDAGDLAAVLAELLTNPPQPEPAAAKAVAEAFAPLAIAKRYEALYRQIGSAPTHWAT
jgi:glycosyltransferase involved in cell wall biosynthesis